MHTSLIFIVFLLYLGQSRSQINKFSIRNSRYQVSQPSPTTNQLSSPVQPSSLGRTVNPVSNIFNDRARIMYRPQTAVVFNDGQEKEGDCPITRPASGYSTFKQVRLS